MPAYLCTGSAHVHCGADVGSDSRGASRTSRWFRLGAADPDVGGVCLSEDGKRPRPSESFRHPAGGGRSCSGLFTWGTSRHSWLARLLPFGEESRRPRPSESGTERKCCRQYQQWSTVAAESLGIVITSKNMEQLIEVFSVVSALECGKRDGGSDGIADCAGAQADAA